MWAWLAERGVPYRSTVSAVVERYGVRSLDRADPDDGLWPVCRIADAGPLLLDQRAPAELSLWLEPALGAPPTALRARSYDGRSGTTTFRAAVESLVGVLGYGELKEWPNALAYSWSFGLAAVRLTFWPHRPNKELGMTFGYLDPLRWKATRLEVIPGVVPDLSDAERDLLDAIPVPFERGRLPFEHGPGSSAAHWRRRPPTASGGAFLDPGGRAIAVVRDRVHLVPSEDVERIDLRNLTPGRGAGGAHLRVQVRVDGPGLAWLPLLQDDQAGDLDALADELSRSTGAPLDVAWYPDA